MIKRVTHICLTLAFVLAFAGAYGQSAEFVAAYTFIQQKQVDSAKLHIDRAIKDPVAAKDPQVWYVRGFIYKYYYKTKESDNRKSPARVEALRCFRKSISLDSLHKFTSDNNDNLRSLATRYYNDAAQALDTSNYKIPMQNFGMYEEIMKEVDPKIDLTQKEIEFSMALADIYTKLYNKSPKTRENFLELAKDCYNKVLAAQPNNVSANYNMGILYYNQAVRLIKGADYDIDLTSIDGIQDDQVKLFKQSLPLMKKAHELDPQKEEAIQALSGIYFGLNDFESSKRFQEMIDQRKKENHNPEKKDK
jgi:tetratricopeptide (TPR) repeat protein